MKLYGIPNCDTVRKARKWLDAEAIPYTFHNYKKQGADKAVLAQACEVQGWETVLNRRGNTWRKLDDTTKESVTDTASAITLMMEQTSLIKRPIITHNGNIEVGFNIEAWSTIT